MKVYKYVTKKESIENSPDNNCFCPVSTDEEGNEFFDCPTSGLINIMPCVQAPILVSYPHFYLGDESLLNYVIGVKPDPELHASFVYFEPVIKFINNKIKYVINCCLENGDPSFGNEKGADEYKNKEVGNFRTIRERYGWRVSYVLDRRGKNKYLIIIN